MSVVAGDLLVFGSSADCRVMALDAADRRRALVVLHRCAGSLRADRLEGPGLRRQRRRLCIALPRPTAAAEPMAGRTERRDDPGQRPHGLALAGARRAGRARRHRLLRGRHLAVGRHLSCARSMPRRAKSVWRNDEAGKIYMAQPHGGAMAESGVSPQGYLVATADQLLVPTGRAVPAGVRSAPTASSCTTTCKRTATSAARRRWPSATASTTAASLSTRRPASSIAKLGAATSPRCPVRSSSARQTGVRRSCSSSRRRRPTARARRSKTLEA